MKKTYIIDVITQLHKNNNATSKIILPHCVEGLKGPIYQLWH